jgi:hypothetical protein
LIVEAESKQPNKYAAWPIFQCHKRVRALKIHAVTSNALGAYLIFESGNTPMQMDFDWQAKHRPQDGGYLVVYDDGYASFSPAKAFEEGYTRLEAMAQSASSGVTSGIGIGTEHDTRTIEQEIQDKGLTAPRVTPADIDVNIVSEHYFTAADAAHAEAAIDVYHEQRREFSGDLELALLTFCVIVLRNGFTVTGESACASPENFNADIGRKIARQNAVQKIWPLMGYELKQRLSCTSTVGAGA